MLSFPHMADPGLIFYRVVSVEGVGGKVWGSSETSPVLHGLIDSTFCPGNWNTRNIREIYK